jgi:2-C-methyl-D-erythritol 4-phosphate cytidylyltransferase
MKKHAIIVAGGSGNRMQSDIPKQFIPISGMPMLTYSIQAFYDSDPNTEICVVIPASKRELWKSLCEEFSFKVFHKLVNGGDTRFHSVKNGLDTIQSNGLVAVHDGARPLITRVFIEKLYKAAELNGSAIPSIPFAESVRLMNENTSEPINRDALKIIQTPQVFHIDLLKEAYRQDYNPTFTDDATVIESIGHNVNLVDGHTDNIKVTYPKDIKIATAILRRII